MPTQDQPSLCVVARLSGGIHSLNAGPHQCPNPHTPRPICARHRHQQYWHGCSVVTGGAGGEQVVAYFSRVFNKSEQRYYVTRRELLAVVLVTQHFKYYLCGMPFTIRTDHAALQWPMSFREPEGQLAQWLEELQSFHFTVVHRTGAQHANAKAYPGAHAQGMAEATVTGRRCCTWRMWLYGWRRTANWLLCGGGPWKARDHLGRMFTALSVDMKGL